MENLNRAIEYFGSKAALARAVGLKPMAIRQWEVRGRVSVDGANRIERATGGAITREQLRPDVFSKAVA